MTLENAISTDPGLSSSAPLFQFASVQSTMDVAAQIWATQKDQLTTKTQRPLLAVIQAEEQRAGRGRRGRTWLSPLGGLYVSYLVRVPEGQLPQSHQLSLIAGLALGRVLEELGVDYHLKWPNDVFIRTQKMAGILIEHVEPGIYCVGMGVNLSQPNGLASFGVDVTVMEMGARLTQSLEKHLNLWMDQGFDALRTAWLERSWTKGVSVRVVKGDKVYKGCYQGVNEEGFLLCQLEDGSSEIFSAGDVSLQQTIRDDDQIYKGQR